MDYVSVDLLMAAGSMIGLLNKVYALRDPSTTWSRKSNGINLVTYPFTALAPFYLLELWTTLVVGSLNFLTWAGIYVWRAPESENWFGQKELGEK